jgi:hypothetical protein
VGGLAPFVWHSYDVRPILPDGWKKTLIDIALKNARDRTLIPSSVTSREASDVAEVPVSTVGGETLRVLAPWLFSLYENDFRDLAETVSSETVVTASRDRIAVNLNVQRGKSMRYEAHVDSNPVEGLLYVTDHPVGAGGELVVAQSEEAFGVEEIDKSPAVIYPVAGHLVFFDARRHSHYVRPLAAENGIRIVAAMNFYTPSCPESARPVDLDRHLFGADR